MWQALSDQVHGSEVVDLHLPLLVVDGHVFDRRAVGDAGVVDQNVYRSNCFGNLPDETRDGSVVAHVERNYGDTWALGYGFLAKLLYGVRQGGGHDAVAIAVEELNKLVADA